MKRIIIIIALVLPLISLSQVNKSIIDTTKTWYNGVSTMTGFYTNVYQIKGDTLIENKSYNKVNVTGYFGDSNYLDNCRLKFYVREDSSRVFIRENNYLNNISDEFIVYDFNLNKGDTITLPTIVGGNILFYEKGLITIDSVDSININGSVLKRMFISSLEIHIPKTYNIQWIEGIGSIQGLFEVGTIIDGGGGVLNCLYQGDSLIYTSGSSHGCLYYVGLDDIDNDISVKIYPTVVSDVLNISSTSYPLNISIIDLFGKEVQKETLYYDKTINCSLLKSGFYGCKLTTKDNKTLFKKIIKQ